MLICREPARVQIHLPHSQVSRVHAKIVVQDGAAVVSDLNSANGAFVNGARVQAPMRIQPGDQIDVGPYALVFTGGRLIPRSRSDNVALIAHQLRRVVPNRETGKPLTLLDDVTIVIRPREFASWFPRSVWEPKSGRSASSHSSYRRAGTQSVHWWVPTQSVGTRNCPHGSSDPQ